MPIPEVRLSFLLVTPDRGWFPSLAGSTREVISEIDIRAAADLADLACLRMALYTTDRPDRAVEVGLELRTFGIEWPNHPGEEEVRAEYDLLRLGIGERPIETLVDLASTRDPALLALMEVLRAILSPALHTETKLHDLALLRMANLSLEHGHGDGSPLAFAQLSVAIGSWAEVAAKFVGIEEKRLW